MNAKSITFENTLIGLSSGLQVRHIATFGLETCAQNEHTADVLSRFPEFDQIPVKDAECIVGVVERSDNSGGIVRDRMRRLDDGILVSTDEPLLDFIPLMANPPFYRLILKGTRIDGIVTRSDLLKLPVRLLSFALVTHLELVMMEIISQELLNDDDWLALLSEGRQKKIKDKHEEYRRKRMDPPLLELTDYCDKKTIMKKRFGLGTKFDDDLKDVEKLRNLIAHAANYAPSEAELQAFIKNLQKAQHWIKELSV